MTGEALAKPQTRFMLLNRTRTCLGACSGSSATRLSSSLSCCVDSKANHSSPAFCSTIGR